MNLQALHAVADELGLHLTKGMPYQDALATVSNKLPDNLRTLSKFALRALVDLGLLDKAPDQDLSEDCFGCYYNTKSVKCKECYVSVRCAQVGGRPILSVRVMRSHDALAAHLSASMKPKKNRTLTPPPPPPKDVKEIYRRSRDQIVGQIYDSGYNESKGLWKKHGGGSDEFTLNHGIVLFKSWSTCCHLLIRNTSDVWIKQWDVPRGRFGYEWRSPDIDRTIEMLNSLMSGVTLTRKED